MIIPMPRMKIASSTSTSENPRRLWPSLSIPTLSDDRYH